MRQAGYLFHRMTPGMTKIKLFPFTMLKFVHLNNAGFDTGRVADQRFHLIAVPCKYAVIIFFNMGKPLVIHYQGVFDNLSHSIYKFIIRQAQQHINIADNKFGLSECSYYVLVAIKVYPVFAANGCINHCQQACRYETEFYAPHICGSNKTCQITYHPSADPGYERSPVSSLFQQPSANFSYHIKGLAFLTGFNHIYRATRKTVPVYIVKIPVSYNKGPSALKIFFQIIETFSDNQK